MINRTGGMQTWNTVTLREYVDSFWGASKVESSGNRVAPRGSGDASCPRPTSPPPTPIHPQCSKNTHTHNKMSQATDTAPDKMPCVPDGTLGLEEGAGESARCLERVSATPAHRMCELGSVHVSCMCACVCVCVCVCCSVPHSCPPSCSVSPRC